MLIYSMAGAIIMMVSYGHKVDSVDDQYVALAEAVRLHAEARPGTELVDVFPICELCSSFLYLSHDINRSTVKYLPSWFPGAEFKKVAAIGQQLSVKMRSAPYEMIKKRLVR